MRSVLRDPLSSTNGIRRRGVLRPLVSLFVLAALSARTEAADAPSFEDAVRPILKANCFECHGEGKSLKGKLDLRLKRFIEKGGESGAGLVNEHPETSLLIEKLRDESMPPGKKKLTAAEIAVIEKWIAGGAKTKNPEPETVPVGFYISPQDRAWWSYQPVKRPASPKPDSARIRNPIDQFVLNTLRENKLDLSPDADPYSLIRRVTFDLTGLPPTPAEVDAFVAAAKADPDAAYEKLIDRLLASRAYGEHWGRHWLDVAGYADSEGFSPEDPVRSNAWRYRDYVIRSIQADKPFDRFIIEQLAGDELVKTRNPTLKSADLKPEDIDALTGTGFLRMASDGNAIKNNANQKTAREQFVTDSIKIVSSTFLGLTVGCAQCHNHRYDPISQEDYYRVRAFLEPGYDLKAIREFSLMTPADRNLAAKLEAEAGKIDAARKKIEAEKIVEFYQAELAKIPEEIRKDAAAAAKAPFNNRTDEQVKLLRQYPKLQVSVASLRSDKTLEAELKKMTDEAAALRATKPTEEFLRMVAEPAGAAPKTFLYFRGDPEQPQEAIDPGSLTVLENVLPLKVEKPANLPSSGRRLALARWLTDRNQPLTSRVLVNRIWMHHFGRGLVDTPGDFGRKGSLPTHPELLDWMSAEFVENGWSLKKLHKLILTSTTYRQSSKRTAEGDKIDTDNRLLHRANLRRLESESVRDAMLAVTGKLNLKPFGPPVPVRYTIDGSIVVGKGTKSVVDGSLKVEPLPEGEVDRRSVYVEVRRSMPLGVLETFDNATLEPNCEIRRVSNGTPQALLLLNGEFMLEQSRNLAERVRREAGDDIDKQIRLAWKLTYGLDATDEELRTAVSFVASQKDPLAALTLFAQALLCSNRFLYVD